MWQSPSTMSSGDKMSSKFPEKCKNVTPVLFSLSFKFCNKGE